MLRKSLFCALLVTVCLQFNYAEEQKFKSIPDFVKHEALEFTKRTYGAIAENFDMIENLLKDLEAYEPKTEQDNDALEKLTKLVADIKTIKGITVNDENFGVAYYVIRRTLAHFDYMEGISERQKITNSPAVRDLLKKTSFNSIPVLFFRDFRAFASQFIQDLENLIDGVEQDNLHVMEQFLKEFRAADDAKKLRLFFTYD